MSDDFVHLHTHSDFSMLDGCGKIDDYVKTAKARGNKAIAFADHGTMRGLMRQHEQCKELDIKPIYGCEFYVSPNMRRAGVTDEEKADLLKGVPKSEQRKVIKDFEEREGIRDRWHLTVHARTQQGLQNMYRLSSAAFIDGFYYKPRIDINELIRYSEGLTVSTGCLSSPINDQWIQGKKRAALDFADRLHEHFGEDLMLEVQPHAIRDQRVANKLMLKLRDRYGGANRLVAMQDAHYVDQEDAQHHEVLLCIGTGSSLSAPDRFKFDGDEFHMRTRKQMRDAFRRHHEFIPDHLVKEALNHTIEFAEQCSAAVEVDYHKALLPDPGIPKKYKGDHTEFFRDLCIQGWAWRNIPGRAEAYAAKQGITKKAAMALYVARLKHEMNAIKKQGFIKYFLIVRDIYKFAREADIMFGPGRGSVGGSLVGYLMGFTIVDPIEHGLIFERFINPFRVDEPDVDMDFEDRRRGEIIEYLVNKYGRDKVAQIATVGKLSGKQCLIDVSRVLDVPLVEVRKVTASIIERSSGDERASQTIADSFKEFEVCRQFDEKYPEVLRHAKKLEGLAKSLGIHAAGVVTSPVPLTDIIPLETRNHDGTRVQVTALDMYGAAACGLVKLDVLGLRTLTVVKECLLMIKERHGKVIDLEADDFDLNDPKALEGFTKHDFGGVFQYDTTSAEAVCRGVKFVSFEDIAAMTALNRPGTSRSGLATEFVKRKKNPKLASKVHFHPKVSEITADTLGIIVYQEHVIRIFTECAGFAPGTADSLRKTIAKKIGDETLGREREAFIKGCAEHSGMDAATAGKIMDAITFFGSYGFNKSHATEYGMIAYWCMWLKVYYPIEFYWALLKNEPDRIRIQQLSKDAKKHDIDLLPPHVNSSRKAFSIDADRHAIRGSLVDIKGVGEKAAQSLMEAQPFKDFADLFERVDRRRCHKGVFVALAKAGALDGIVPNTKWFVENCDTYWKELTRAKRRPEAIAALEAEMRADPDYSEEERMVISSSVNPLAFGKHPVDAYRKFMDRTIHVPVEVMERGDDYFKDFDGVGHYIIGVIVEVKYNQIGDFHTGEMPTDVERERMFWGKRYANVNIEEPSGKQNRCKFDWHIFDRYRAIIDKGVGTPVIAHVTASNYTQTLRANFAVDIEAFRAERGGVPETLWEHLICGRHPASDYPWKDDAAKKARETNDRFRRSSAGGIFCGVVTHVQLKYDRKGGLMAMFGLLAADGGYVSVMCFASVWRNVMKTVKTGRLLKIALHKKPDRRTAVGWSCFYEGGQIKWLKKADITLE